MTMQTSVAWQQCNTVKYNMILCLSLFAENSKDEKQAVNTSFCYWQRGSANVTIQNSMSPHKNVIFWRKQNCCPDSTEGILCCKCCFMWSLLTKTTIICHQPHPQLTLKYSLMSSFWIVFICVAVFMLNCVFKLFVFLFYAHLRASFCRGQ